MRNKVYKGNDNPIVLQIKFLGDYADNGLLNFTDISVTIGDETYTLIGNAANVKVVSATELHIAIGDVTNLAAGSYHIEVVGISNVYDDGYVLAKDGVDGLDPVWVIE